jgi:hypothetical protein
VLRDDSGDLEIMLDFTNDHSHSNDIQYVTIGSGKRSDLGVVGSRVDNFSPAENSVRTEHRPMPTTFGDLILLYIENVNYRVRKISSSFHYCNTISHHHLQVSLRYQ